MRLLAIASAISYRLVCLWIIVGLLLIASQVEASSIQVLGAAAHTGNYGARVSVAGCATAGDLSLNGAVSSDQCAQGKISTSGATTVSGNVTFTAGTSIALGDGFSTAPGATFRAVVTSGLTAADAYLQAYSPAPVRHYVVRYYVDPTNLFVRQGEEFGQFIAYDYLNSEQFRAVITHVNSVGNEIYLKAAGSAGPSVPLALPDGFDAVEIDWRADNGSGGEAVICVNDNGSRSSSDCKTIAHNNTTGEVDYVRWGVPDMGTCSSCGALDMDDFYSRYATGPIGP